MRSPNSVVNPVVNSVTLRVPATTANIGPGFDCLGAALSLYNQFRFTPQDADRPVVIRVSGRDAERVSTDEADNLVYQAFCHLYGELHQPVPSVAIEVEMAVPLARGLGSSATAIVGGLVGANLLAGQPFGLEAIARFAMALEGHPDNVVPALMGGCRLAASGVERDWEICPLTWHPEVVPVVAIPDFELSTQAARQVLPASYSRADAVFNAAHLGLLLQGLATGHGDWLQAALQDRIHQPYRQALIPGYAALQEAAIAAGAWGVVISGAGPTLLALTSPAVAQSVAVVMQQAWQSAGVSAEARVVQLDAQGTMVVQS